jgi:hypothetical protein
MCSPESGIERHKRNLKSVETLFSFPRLQESTNLRSQPPFPKSTKMEQHHHPWEALDVDLEDENDSLSQTHSQSILKRCSSRLSQTQTLTFQSQPSKQSSPPPLIPGPAGALQAAMHRRTQHIHTSLLRPQEHQEPLPTQEFIRRVVENPHHHDDHDFATNPWLFALDFLRLQGFIYFMDFENVNWWFMSCFIYLFMFFFQGNGVVARTTLSSIKNGLNTDRVAQVCVNYCRN